MLDVWNESYVVRRLVDSKVGSGTDREGLFNATK